MATKLNCLQSQKAHQVALMTKTKKAAHVQLLAIPLLAGLGFARSAIKAFAVMVKPPAYQLILRWVAFGVHVWVRWCQCPVRPAGTDVGVSRKEGGS